MRNMSFALTAQQIRDGTKNVTRRIGWNNLKIGEILMACEKSRGIGKGGHIVRIRKIRVTDIRKEQLNSITPEEVLHEGFVGMTPDEFVAMFCEANGCKPDATVNRFRFEYVEAQP
jgi:hypothetical protein